MKKILISLLFIISLCGGISPEVSFAEEMGAVNEERIKAKKDADRAVFEKMKKHCSDMDAFDNKQNWKTKEGVEKPEGMEYCIELQEPIMGYKSVRGNQGFGLISNYLHLLYLYGAAMIGIICVLIMVISGGQIIFGGASPDMVGQAKERIIQAVLSLILLFCTALILQTINPGFFKLF